MLACLILVVLGQQQSLICTAALNGSDGRGWWWRQAYTATAWWHNAASYLVCGNSQLLTGWMRGNAGAGWGGGEAKEGETCVGRHIDCFPAFLGDLWRVRDCFDRRAVMLISCPAGNINQSAVRKKPGPSADLAEQLMGMNVDSSLIIIRFKFFLHPDLRCNRWKYLILFPSALIR